MNERSELPPDIQTLTAELFGLVEESGRGHARVRVTNASLLIRHVFPMAAGVLVDTLGWYDRVGGIDVLQIHDRRGKVLWRCTCSTPRPAYDTTTADE